MTCGDSTKCVVQINILGSCKTCTEIILADIIL